MRIPVGPLFFFLFFLLVGPDALDPNFWPEPFLPISSLIYNNVVVLWLVTCGGFCIAVLGPHSTHSTICCLVLGLLCHMIRCKGNKKEKSTKKYSVERKEQKSPRSQCCVFSENTIKILIKRFGWLQQRSEILYGVNCFFKSVLLCLEVRRSGEFFSSVPTSPLSYLNAPWCVWHARIALEWHTTVNSRRWTQERGSSARYLISTSSCWTR